MALDSGDVVRLARLARLSMTPDETDSLVHDLAKILEYVHSLNQVDTRNTLPLTHPHAGAGSSWREDVSEPGLNRQVVLEQAPAVQGPYFRVPAVVEETGDEADA